MTKADLEARIVDRLAQQELTRRLHLVGTNHEVLTNRADISEQARPWPIELAGRRPRGRGQDLNGVNGRVDGIGAGKAYPSMELSLDWLGR